jgi:hypothetical protein
MELVVLKLSKFCTTNCYYSTKYLYLLPWYKTIVFEFVFGTTEKKIGTAILILWPVNITRVRPTGEIFI